MTRVLVAVGAALALCFVIFGVAVYVTREEEHVAVDSDLAERVSRAVVDARESGEPFALTEPADFAWDRVVIVERGTPRTEIDRRLGFSFEGELPYDVESTALLVFARGSELARFADYRGTIPIEGLPLELDREQARFEVGESVRAVSAG